MTDSLYTYELTYIVNAVISDDQTRDLVKRVSSFITESGGEIIDVDEWGSRRLGYPIQKKRNGYYVNMYFRGSGASISRLERALEIDDNILRYLTLRMDAKMIRNYEDRKSARAAAKIEAENAEKPEVKAERRVGETRKSGAKAEKLEAETRQSDAKAEKLEVETKKSDAKAEKSEVEAEKKEAEADNTDAEEGKSEVAKGQPEAGAEKTEVAEDRPEADTVKTEAEEAQPEAEAELTEVEANKPESIEA